MRVGDAVGGAGHDHAAIAVANKDDVGEILVGEDTRRCRDVRIEVDHGIGKMRALAEAGIGRRHQPMAAGDCIKGCIFFHAQPADHAP